MNGNDSGAASPFACASFSKDNSISPKSDLFGSDTSKKQPNNDSFEEQQHNDDDQSNGNKQGSSADGRWTCEKCNNDNPSSKSRCEGCLAWKDGKKKKIENNNSLLTYGSGHASNNTLSAYRGSRSASFNFSFGDNNVKNVKVSGGGNGGIGGGGGGGGAKLSLVESPMKQLYHQTGAASSMTAAAVSTRPPLTPNEISRARIFFSPRGLLESITNNNHSSPKIGGKENTSNLKEASNPVASLPIDGGVSKRVSSSVGKDFTSDEFEDVLSSFLSSGSKFIEVGMPDFKLSYQPDEGDVKIPPEGIRKLTNRAKSEMGNLVQYGLEPVSEYAHLLSPELSHMRDCYRILLANRTALVAQYGINVKPWDIPLEELRWWKVLSVINQMCSFQCNRCGSKHTYKGTKNGTNRTVALVSHQSNCSQSLEPEVCEGCGKTNIELCLGKGREMSVHTMACKNNARMEDQFDHFFKLTKMYIADNETGPEAGGKINISYRKMGIPVDGRTYRRKRVGGEWEITWKYGSERGQSIKLSVLAGWVRNRTKGTAKGTDVFLPPGDMRDRLIGLGFTKERGFFGGTQMLDSQEQDILSASSSSMSGSASGMQQYSMSTDVQQVSLLLCQYK